jgi:predicted ArsR family transcriptional regulator
MSQVTETSDQGLIDVLRREGAVGITELADAMGVTPTAVRQRLTRLMGLGLVDRQLEDRHLENVTILGIRARCG